MWIQQTWLTAWLKSTTHTDESVICPLPCTRVHGHSRVASLWLTDEREQCRPSHSDSKADFSPSAPANGWLHRRSDLNSYPFLTLWQTLSLALLESHRFSFLILIKVRCLNVLVHVLFYNNIRSYLCYVTKKNKKKTKQQQHVARDVKEKRTCDLLECFLS